MLTSKLSVLFYKRKASKSRRPSYGVENKSSAGHAFGATSNSGASYGFGTELVMSGGLGRWTWRFLDATRHIEYILYLPLQALDPSILNYWRLYYCLSAYFLKSLLLKVKGVSCLQLCRYTFSTSVEAIISLLSETVAAARKTNHDCHQSSPFLSRLIHIEYSITRRALWCSFWAALKQLAQHIPILVTICPVVVPGTRNLFALILRIQILVKEKLGLQRPRFLDSADQILDLHWINDIMPGFAWQRETYLIRHLRQNCIYQLWKSGKKDTFSAHLSEFGLTSSILLTWSKLW